MPISSSLAGSSLVPVHNSPERWARFLEEHAPGLSWLASTLLEWAELPPGARRAWLVTAQATRAGDVEALAALHEGTGLLAIAAKPGTPPPLFGESDRVRRIVGSPETVEAMLTSVPVLMLRRGPGVRRLVFAYDGESPPKRHPALRRAEPGSEGALDELRKLATEGGEGVLETDLAGAVQQGALWSIQRNKAPVAMFRVDAVARRRIQVVDVCVHPDERGRGLGTELLQSAASVARAEYSRGCVVTAPAAEAAERTATRAGFTPAGVLEDVEFA